MKNHVITNSGEYSNLRAWGKDFQKLMFSKKEKELWSRLSLFFLPKSWWPLKKRSSLWFHLWFRYFSPKIMVISTKKQKKVFNYCKEANFKRTKSWFVSQPQNFLCDPVWSRDPQFEKLWSKAPKLVSKTFNNHDVHGWLPKADRYRSNAFCFGMSINAFHMLISK